MSPSLKARNALLERKRAYEAELDGMTDNQIAGQIEHLENIDPKPGSFWSWALSCATRELDHRL